MELTCVVISSLHQGFQSSDWLKQGADWLYGGGCFRLPKRIPPQIAMEMILTGEPRSADGMHRFGYVNRVIKVR